MSFVLTSPLPEKGATIAIFATFAGHKRVPLWAVSTNSLNPKLRFFNDEIELKVVKTYRRAWSDVEHVGARMGRRTNFLTLDFADTSWNFTASVVLPSHCPLTALSLPSHCPLTALSLPSHLRETLQFMKSKTLILTPRAQGILNS